VEYKASHIIESMWFKRFATPFAVPVPCASHRSDWGPIASYWCWMHSEPYCLSNLEAMRNSCRTLGPEMHETRQRCLWSFQAIIIHIYISYVVYVYVYVYILYIYIYIYYIIRIQFSCMYIYTVCEYIYIYGVCICIYILYVNIYIYIYGVCTYIYI